MEQIKLGKYKHFKGKFYQVIGLAIHSETLEEMVVYKPEKQNATLWVRPLKMFDETIELNGEQVKRFEFLG